MHAVTQGHILDVEFFHDVLCYFTEFHRAKKSVIEV